MIAARWALLVVVAAVGCDSPRSGTGTSRSGARTAGVKGSAVASASPSAVPAPLPATSPSSLPSPSLVCADAWLKAHGLNEFGDPVGTVYAGGTPLFDEAAGRQRDRLEVLRAKHLELRTACP